MYACYYHYLPHSKSVLKINNTSSKAREASIIRVLTWYLLIMEIHWSVSYITERAYKNALRLNSSAVSDIRVLEARN